MSVVAKMFLSTRVEGPAGGAHYTLGVVCRGELNKDWAAATPSGTGKLYGDELDQVWDACLAGDRVGEGAREVYVRLIPDQDGDFKMMSCDFAYNGCKVKLSSHYRMDVGVSQELEFNVNATAATEVLRRAYADGLLSGEPPRFRVEVTAAEVSTP